MTRLKSKPASPVLPGVDTHFHVFEAGRAVPGARYVPGYDAPLSAWQALAAPCGVTHGVLVQTSFMGTDNRHLLAQLAAQPARLRGIAVVSPQATLADLAPLHAAGVRGIRLNLAGASHDMTAWGRATALWDAVAHLGWHAELHTDRGVLPAVLQALPQALPLVLDHFARPAQAALHDPTVRALQPRAGRVHIKLSGAYRLEGVPPQTLAGVWLDELGPQALLWGSDWPCTNHEAQADYARLFAFLSDWLAGEPGLLAAVRSHNPLRLYWG